MARRSIDIYHAKIQLSRLVDQAAGGQDVLISRAGKPVARLTRLEEVKRRVRFGLLKGSMKLAKDFDAPLPKDIQERFEGRG
jgi:prevent-host-death family protein